MMGDSTLSSRRCDGETVYTVDSEGQTLGFIAIDSTIAGRARGGLRMVPDLSESEVRAAARSMTLKYGFLGLPQGGAKAGLFGDPEGPPDQKQRTLRAFAWAARDLLRAGDYVPDADLGTRADEIRDILDWLGVPVSPRDWRANRSGVYTAVSCLSAAEVMLAECGETLDGLKVAVEGFGDVGSALAQRLDERGAVVVAISTSQGAAFCSDGFDVPKLLLESGRAGSEVVHRVPGARTDHRSTLLTAEVDVLFPCARMHGIHAGNAEDVAARFVCAGANDPMSPEARLEFGGRGIRYLPDFVTNAGGVLGGTLEFAGVRPREIESIVEARIRREVADLLQRSEGCDRALWSLAEAEALDRHREMRDEQDSPNLSQRIRRFGIAAYRRGWIPERLMAPVASRMLG